MEFGVHLPNVGPLASRYNILTIARRAEERGFHSLWTSDHIVIPLRTDSAYPGGRFPVRPEMPFLEPLSVLHFAAAVTERVRLGTSVLVVPMRHPIITAKELATLDVLSGGRLIFGAGVGWLKEEFDILGAPFHHRGPRTDEYLEVIVRCWTEEEPRFEGRFIRLDNVGFAPKPLQKPRPPIWIGGTADGALRRAARIGDAWQATGPLTPQQLARLYGRVQQYAREYGRDPASILFSVRSDNLSRMEKEEAVAYLQALREIGVQHLVVAFPGRRLEDSLALMDRFLEEIAPAAA
ncbi:Phthiodiolone/phenolphthiodiolone dimycocerosates ketoreductase [bacterium HR25]|nr:Phthiodiolone/phenolphthiodiolone dimycocerosates ketoreductase [bacterium HR25]